MLNTIKLINGLVWKPSTSSSLLSRYLSTTNRCLTYEYDPESNKPYPEPKRWGEKNLIVLPPPQPGEPQNIRTYCHYRANIKYSPKKMWFITSFIRGMTVDEAVKQLSFVPKKGAQIVKEVILEAQEIAVRDHNFEYKSNMWIGESFATKGLVIKGLRKHARMRFGEIRYFYSHYFLRLVEGTPPKDYYGIQRDGNQKLEEYIEDLRKRRIDYGL